MNETNDLPIDILKTGAATLGILLSPRMLEQFDVYAGLLSEWNKRINLTAITEPHQVAEKHFLDSLSVLGALPAEPFTLVDVGSGAGFPGLPLAIARPDIQVTLIEAVAKKSAFLKAVIAALSLPNANVVVGRAEMLAHEPDFRERFDAAVARAVAQLATLAELTLPFIRVDGTFIAQKILGSESVESATGALETLGGVFEREIAVPVPALADRRLVIIRKVKATPETYPRRVGVPTKKPLGGLTL